MSFIDKYFDLNKLKTINLEIDAHICAIRNRNNHQFTNFFIKNETLPEIFDVTLEFIKTFQSLGMDYIRYILNLFKIYNSIYPVANYSVTNYFNTYVY